MYYSLEEAIEKARIKLEEETCNRCDERHDDGECGADSPDPDVLYDEMHTQY